jgi:hypothetical protein
VNEVGKNRNSSQQILYRLKLIEDKLDGLSHKMMEEDPVEFRDGASTKENKSDNGLDTAQTFEQGTTDPRPSESYQANPNRGLWKAPYRGYPNYPFMVGRPNANYSTGTMQPQTRHLPQVQESDNEQTPMLDIATLIKLMNDPLVKQLMGYFKKKS